MTKKMNSLVRPIFRFAFWLSKRENLTMENIAERLKLTMSVAALKNGAEGLGHDESTHLRKAAASALAVGEFQAADEAYTKLVKAFPADCDLYFGAAMTNVALHRFDKALLLCSWGALLSGGRIDFIYLSAECHRRLDRTKEAVQGYRLVLNNSGADPKFNVFRQEAQRIIELLEAQADDLTPDTKWMEKYPVDQLLALNR